ncbi:ATP-binding protein [Thermomonospora cellulosilytica]|uniref:DNA-binding CsgD family transcriptional regulator/Arc/MetJ-type ribon-helix-helix transcriptional regulator n=1 Tax=Thermomonospora cellulosilytica TaxID=1411118 RepID=A0A7W3MTK4_9ACTN|nr:AAA family ATPase [Thermomonospora cellulosilytica]MBA9001655.1 DNA-binding CsgD family transcriptional regulator/Arc/MetJ-type ribon-helix-helix transcriptional regulator [Thermomonospora cellulosilytica]
MLFVGRRELVARIDGDAARGDFRIVVVGGPAGIGKTRLLEHVAARVSGRLVLRGACVELGTEGLPMAPVTAVLRQLAASPGPEELARLLPGVDGLLRLLPEFDAGGRGPEPRARTFDLFAALLRRLSAQRPVLLLIDDLQWADPSTRDLLDVLARTLGPARVLLVAAYRSDDLDRGHPLRPFLAQWGRLPNVHRVELEPLSRAETAELVRRLHPGADERFVERVFRRSGGNPYFAEELARAGGEEMPDTLRDLLLARVQRLPEHARHLVRVASVGGGRVPHGLLAATAGLDEADLLSGLRAAADARVLIPQGDGYAFQHGLFREAVRTELLPAERARLHRAYADALTVDPGLVDPDRHAAELAFHWHGAGVADRALAATLRAAEVADRLHALAERAQLLERALDLWEEVPEPPADVDRLGLFETAIMAAGWAGEGLHALDLIDRALAEADRSREPGRTAMLLAQRGMALAELGRDGAVTAVDEALSLAVPDAGRARVLDLAAAVLTLSGEPARGRDAAREAADLATDTRLETNARITHGWALWELGEYESAAESLRTALDLARRDGDDQAVARAALNLAGTLHDLGRDAEAEEVARTGLEASHRAGLERTLGVRLAARLVAVLTDAGRWPEAETAGRRALALDPPGVQGAELHALLSGLALAQGRMDAAREHLSAARSLQEAAAPVLRQSALLALAENAVPALGEALTGTVQDWSLLATAAQMPELAAEAAKAASSLPTNTPVWSAHATQLAAALGKDAWTDAVTAWDGLRRPFPAARARLRAAEAALASRDRSGAQDLLRTAADQAERLGAEPLLEEIRLLARSSGLPLTDTAPDEAPAIERLGLTEREAEVLRLVAAGKSNRQIGEELFISTKTASVHVSNILAKLNVGSRGEAAALAHRLGLF